MKKKIILIISTVLIVGAGITCVTIMRAHFLPSSFTITLHQDASSSGGNRHMDETFSFAKKVLVNGTATYTSSAGGGCTKDCDNTEQCMITDNQWVEVTHWQGCQETFGSVPTKKSLEAAIASGDLKKDSDCRHLDTCYQITR